MSIAAQSASAFVRSAIIAVSAGALSGWLCPLLAALRGRARTFGWALALAPFLTPPLLVSYAYSRFALALVVTPWCHVTLYSALLFLKLVPVAVVVRWLMPPPLSAEARHCHRTLAAGLIWRHAQFHLRGVGHGGWFAVGIVFLLAFADFEVASLWSIQTWTVAVFDAQIGGMNLRETLRLAAFPVGVQVAVLMLLLTRAAGTPIRGEWQRGCDGKRAFVYLAIAALAVCVLPIIAISAQAAAGIPAVMENFILGSEIGASVLFAVGAAGASRVLASASRGIRLSKPRASQSDQRSGFARDRDVREGGTRALRGVPGLLGSLIVALLVLTLFQTPLLSAAYDTPLPLLLALTIVLLPLALLLDALLQTRRMSPMRHIARQLESRRLAWELERQPLVASFGLLFCWAYFDFAASSILAPIGMTPVFVRLHNLAHYGQTAVLSAMMLAAFLTPTVLLAVLIVAGRMFAALGRSHPRSVTGDSNQTGAS